MCTVASNGWYEWNARSTTPGKRTISCSRRANDLSYSRPKWRVSEKDDERGELGWKEMFVFRIGNCVAQHDSSASIRSDARGSSAPLLRTQVILATNVRLNLARL